MKLGVLCLAVIDEEVPLLQYIFGNMVEGYKVFHTGVKEVLIVSVGKFSRDA